MRPVYVIMPTFILTSTQWFARSPTEVFDFYADAFNLERITPPWLRFRVLTPSPIVLAVGVEIDYWLRLHCVPLRWTSRIAVWEPDSRFVDEQIHGPYHRWYHEHVFVSQNGGTLVQDRVEYAVPGGYLVHRILVRNDLRRIFTYRQEKLAVILGASLCYPPSLTV